MIQAEARRPQNVAYAANFNGHSHGLCHPGEQSSELRVESEDGKKCNETKEYLGDKLNKT